MDTAIFDADSHLMETPEWLGEFADPAVRDRLSPLGLAGAGAGAAELMASLPALWQSHREQEIGAEVLKGPKGWMAPGALDTEVRSRVLDALGIEAQLVFPTFALGHFASSKDPEVLYGGTAALNRAMVDFCAPDPRLKAVGYLPLNDPERARATLEDALDTGVAAVWVPSDAPGDFSPTHVDLEPVWARLAEAGVPFVLHVGGGKLLPTVVPQQRAAASQGLAGRRREPAVEGLPGAAPLARAVPRLHGPRRRLRTPSRRCAAPPSSSAPAGCPGCCAMSTTRCARSPSSSRPCRSCTLLPSEYLRRQVRFTPFPFEDTAWLLEQCGPDLFMFSTDYPHPEGRQAPVRGVRRRRGAFRRRRPASGSSGGTGPSSSAWPEP